MFTRVSDARYISGPIGLRFSDSADEVDLSGELYGEMFERLRDAE